MVGSDHFHQRGQHAAVPGRQGAVYDANPTTRSVSSGCADDAERAGGPVGALRSGIDAGFDLAFSNELRIDHSITCPIITLRPRRTC